MREMSIITAIILIIILVFGVFSGINSVYKEKVIKNILEDIAEKYMKDIESEGYLSDITEAKIENEISQRLNIGRGCYCFVSGTRERQLKGKEVFLEIEYNSFSLLNEISVRVFKFGISGFNGN